MKQLVVLSGKGGTGKTTVTAALAHLASGQGTAVLVDADVDAPNLGLILAPRVLETTDFSAGGVAEVTAERCAACGLCQEVCRYEAVMPLNGVYAVDQVACEGCAACVYVCPQEAIRMVECRSGQWFRSDTRFGTLFHALLDPGRENSGKLVSMVRQQAVLEAAERQADWVIVDGAPGIGCPVIAALGGADAVLMVSEPTVSGLHDLERVLQLAEHFQTAAGVCLNKADLSPRLARETREMCSSRGVPIVGELPYDDIVPRAMQQALAVTEMGESDWSARSARLWAAVRDLMAS